MARPPYYARVVTSSPERLFDPERKGLEQAATAFVQSVFKSKTGEGESTYEVWNERDEVRAVAAHMIANPKPGVVSTCYLVRFCQADLDASGVTVDETVLGTTGIAVVDFTHRDLCGKKKQQIVELTKSAMRRLHAGEDVVRLIKKIQLEAVLTQFIAQGIADRPTHTAHWCECALERRRDTDVCRDRGKAETELERLEFPDEVLTPRARALWAENGRAEGAALKDWYDALRETRARYQTHYLEHCHR